MERAPKIILFTVDMPTGAGPYIPLEGVYGRFSFHFLPRFTPPKRVSRRLVKIQNTYEINFLISSHFLYAAHRISGVTNFMIPAAS